MSHDPARVLDVCLLWHMHQPSYLDGATGESILPWVRLHATKSYLDMAEACARAPEGARSTVNFTPVLLDQLARLGRGEVKDVFLELSKKPADQLEPEESRFILRYFFMANRDTMVKPHPRYEALFAKRGLSLAGVDLDEVARRFSQDEMRDLQVWFNLCWFGWAARDRFPVVREMLARGSQFSEADKAAVLDAQLECVNAVVPAWKKLEDEGRVELTATPFYHPILPLVINTRHARRAVPDMALPEDFLAPDDAQAQVDRAVSFHRRTWGREPKGMWPAEGSVSPEVIPLFRKAGIRWIATDQDVLFDSLGRRHPAADLYRPWTARQGSDEIVVFFRDRVLSDLVGFTYSKMDPDAAAAEFLGRLRAVRNEAEGDRPCVSVILDGENPWEYYPDGGERFLAALYRGLGEDPGLRAATFSGHLDERKDATLESVPVLHSGSWIQSSFRIWIGQPEENAAWNMLRTAREDIRRQIAGPHPPAPDAAEAAIEHLLRAEGSDWFWWYDDDFHSDNDVQFDLLFRTHIANAYVAANLHPPPTVSHPITKAALGAVQNTRPPTAFIHPRIDGRADRFFEWTGAGYYAVGKSEGTMHKATAYFVGIHYGFDLEKLYFRLDPVTRFAREDPKESIEVVLVIFTTEPWTKESREYRLAFPLKRGVSRYTLTAQGDSPAPGPGHTGTIAFDRVVELELPLTALAVSPGSDLDFSTRILLAGTEIDRYPRNGTVRTDVPSPDFELLNWSV